LQIAYATFFNNSSVAKIKLRTAGYRLVYEVRDNEITVFVLSVGKRNRLQAYENARERLN
jgi:putative relE protein